MPRPSPTLERRFLDRPLDTIFGSPVHAAVLRALRPTRAGATGREVARLAGINPQAALNALAILERAGLVQRRVAGRAHLFILNREHRLWTGSLDPLFSGEHAFRERLFHAIGVDLGNAVDSVLVFGSCARGQDTLDSDVDLCLVARDVEHALERGAEASARIELQFGRHLSPIAFTLREFRKKARSGDRLVASIIKEGVHIAGLSLKRMLHG